MTRLFATFCLLLVFSFLAPIANADSGTDAKVADLRRGLRFSIAADPQANAYRHDDTLVLFDAEPLALHIEPSAVFNKHQLPCGDGICELVSHSMAWSLTTGQDATGERVLRGYNAYEAPSLDNLGMDSRMRLLPGTLGGRIVVSATLQAAYKEESSPLWPFATPEIEVTSTAQLTIIAPLVVPASHAFEAHERLGNGRYLNPRSDEDLKYAKALRGGIGVSYPVTHPEVFAPPTYLYRCSEETRDVQLSRHMTLGDFALDYPWFTLGMPQYVCVDPLLLDKLEALIVRLQEHGLARKGLTLIYGYRPPVFNIERIEDEGPSKTLKDPFSTHQYGRAADVIVDDDGDLQLDDLNHDGEVNIFDAAVILYHINIMDRHYRTSNDARVGGAGIYYHHDFWERPVQSPYCHFDVRGYLRGDGTLIRWGSPRSTWPDGTPMRFARIDEDGYPVP